MDPYVVGKWAQALLVVGGVAGGLSALVWWVNERLDGRDRRRRQRPPVMMARPMTRHELKQRKWRQ